MTVPAGTALTVDASNGSMPSAVPLTFAAGTAVTTVRQVGASTALSAAVGTGAAVSFVGTQTLGTLAISGTGHAAVADRTTGVRSVLVVGTLAMAATGTLDLTDNDLVVTAGTAAALSALAGYAGGAWNGPGLASSAAFADAAHLTAIGIVDATTATTLDGVAVPAGAAMAKVTYYGDTNLDSRVDLADYTRTDFGFISGGTAGPTATSTTTAPWTAATTP